MFLLDAELIGLIAIAVFACLAVFYYSFRQFKGYSQDSGKRLFTKNIQNCNNEIYKQVANDIFEEKINYIIEEHFNAFDCDYSYNNKYMIEINDYCDNLSFACLIISGDSESVDSDYVCFEIEEYDEENDEFKPYVDMKSSKRSLNEFQSKDELYQYIITFYEENYKKQ